MGLPTRGDSGPLARLARDGLSLGAGATRLQQGFASLPGELGKNKVVGFLEQTGEFLFLQGVLSFQSNPLRAGHVRRGNDAGAFGEFREKFGGTFERKPDFRRLQDANRKNLSAYSEGEIDAPSDLLGRVGKREAQIADPIDIQVHGQECRGNSDLLPRFLEGQSARRFEHSALWAEVTRELVAAMQASLMAIEWLRDGRSGESVGVVLQN